MVQKSFLVVLCLLLLSSCGPKDTPIAIQTAPVTIPIVHPEPPTPIVLTDIHWKILNVEDKIYFGLPVSDYELLATNMLDIKRYIVAQKNIINYYESVTETP